MTETETLLKRSILYRRLIDELEAIVDGQWNPTEKHRMVQVIDDMVGHAESDEMPTLDEPCRHCGKRHGEHWAPWAFCVNDGVTTTMYER